MRRDHPTERRRVNGTSFDDVSRMGFSVHDRGLRIEWHVDRLRARLDGRPELRTTTRRADARRLRTDLPRRGDQRSGDASDAPVLAEDLQGVIGRMSDQSATGCICRKNGRCRPGDGTDIEIGDTIEAPNLATLYIEDPKQSRSWACPHAPEETRMSWFADGQRSKRRVSRDRRAGDQQALGQDSTKEAQLRRSDCPLRTASAGTTTAAPRACPRRNPWPLLL